MKDLNNKNEITRFNAETKDDVVGYIYRSYDYKQFNINKVNRAISKQHVNEIATAIKTKKSKLPIIQVNPQMEIIDGQHRFMALRKLGLPIYYYIDRQSSDESIIQINSKQTRWHLPQFIHARDEQGYPDYKELLGIVRRYNNLLAPSGVVAIFGGNEDWSGGGMSKKVQEGKFKFGDKEKATEFLEKMINARTKLSKSSQLNNSIIKCFWAYYNRPGIKKDRLVSLINDQFMADSPRDRNSLMVYIGREYNKGLKSATRIPFNQDYKGRFHFEEK